MKKVLGLLLLAVFMVSCASKQELSSYAKGIEATKNKQYEQAIELFNNAVNEENDIKIKASALYNIGFCYGIMKDYDKEIEYYKQSYDTFNDFQPALYDLGKYYYDNKDFDSALKMYEELVEVNSEHEDAYYMLALTQMELGNNDEAMMNMNKAAELGSPDAKEFLAQQNNENDNQENSDNGVNEQQNNENSNE